MLATAAGFAVLAALSPTAVLVGAVYLGSASPRRTMLLYLAGSVTVSVLAGVVVLIALRAGGLSLPANRTPRYGVRIGLGILALAAGMFMARRKPRPGRKKPGLISRMMARPGPVAAFGTGLFVFTPSVSFIAAVQVIATAHSSPAASTLTLAAVVVIDVALVWLPFLLYLTAPEPTAHRLKAFNGWLRAHGHAIAAGALSVAGVLLVLDGVSGLA